MMSHRVVLTSLALLALAAGGRLAADEKKSQPAQHHDRLDAMASRLGLSADQKEKVRKIHHEYDQKEDALEHQVWSLHHEEREAVTKVLTSEQREKARKVLREGVRKEFEKIGSELGLSSEQKEKIHKIHSGYEQKFRSLAAQKGEHKEGQFRHLRHEEFSAIRQELNTSSVPSCPASCARRCTSGATRRPAART